MRGRGPLGARPPAVGRRRVLDPMLDDDRGVGAQAQRVNDERSRTPLASAGPTRARVGPSHRPRPRVASPGYGGVPPRPARVPANAQVGDGPNPWPSPGLASGTAATRRATGAPSADGRRP